MDTLGCFCQDTINMKHRNWVYFGTATTLNEKSHLSPAQSPHTRQMRRLISRKPDLMPIPAPQAFISSLPFTTMFIFT